MRIVGGRLKGRALAPVGSGDAAAHLRPTADRVRESIFNKLMHGDFPPLEDARVLDLFAGTGALGLEALSRGAKRVLFVDDGTKARALIRDNIDRCNAIGATKLYRRDATRLGPNRGDPYNLVFLDPPYGKALGDAALASALAGGWLADQTVVVWEDAKPAPPQTGFVVLESVQYGDTAVTFLGTDYPAGTDA